jgi:competence protein ComGC
MHLTYENLMCMVRKHDWNTAFTRIELLVAVLTLMVLLGILVPPMIQRKRSAQLAACNENLKIVVLGHLLYLNDHEFHAFPGQVSTNKGGTMEYLDAGQLFKHFEQLSNELVFPKLLVVHRTIANPPEAFRVWLTRT